MMSASQEQDAVRLGLREAIKSRVVGACDAALVGGRLQRDYIVQLGMPRERVFLGYDAVDNRHFSNGADRARADAASLRRLHGLPERYILASARFIPKKNLDKLVTAFARALELAPAPHHLVILGDGPGRAALQAAIASADLGSRVVLPGFKDYESLPAFYGLADAFVHVSLAEQWGLVINEATAAGLPLVVSNVCGAAAELIEPGNNGVLVDPMDVEGMAHALQHIMTLSDAEREAMGQASRRIVADWGTERFVDGLLKASEAALDAPQRRLSTLDRLLMSNLARYHISDVS
jgi:glycosyltransferase involved in cell wall biosynthesis